MKRSLPSFLPKRRSTWSHTRRAVLLLVIVIATALPLPAGPLSGARAQDSPPLGFHVGRGDAAHLAAAQAAGASFAVVVFSWADIEPVPNRWYWEKPDAAVRAGEYYGVDILARLDRPPDWAQVSPAGLDSSDLGQSRATASRSQVPWSLDAYGEFARRVAERYGDRLAGVILWNEPNLSLEWHDLVPDPVAYTAMLKAGYVAIKAAAPDLPVALAGLAFTLGDGRRATSDLDYLQALYDAGAGPYFDVLAAHPYGFGRPPDEQPAPDRLNFRRLELQRAVMDRNGDAEKPAWITEMGWRTSAADPSEAWQVVMPRQQATYTLEVLDGIAPNYPWLERLGLWELNAKVDAYGYALWQGPGNETLAYQELVARERIREQATTSASSSQTDEVWTDETNSEPIEILAPDVAIRLGDVGTLHPHWVHLQRGGENFSPEWSGEFFLSPEQALRSYDLVLETMQVDQPTNLVLVNDVEVGELATRSRPDETSTWVTQRLAVGPSLLRSGVNHLSLVSGLRNPAHQYRDWRWENFQFRNARLLAPDPLPEDPPYHWTPLPSPGSWAETSRLVIGADGQYLWLMGNRAGQLWRLALPQSRVHGGRLGLQAQAENRADLVFADVLSVLPDKTNTNDLQVASELAATNKGLVWRPAAGQEWQPTQGSPATYAYTVLQAGPWFYAGFEGRGLWRASHVAGPWQPYALTRRTVLDMVTKPRSAMGDALALATDAGIYLLPSPDTSPSWHRLPRFSRELTDSFTPRVTLSGDGELVARSHDNLWLWDEGQLPGLAGTFGAIGGELGTWRRIGPSPLEGQLQVAVNCCGDDALVGSLRKGIWQLANGNWGRVDTASLDWGDTFDSVIVTDLAILNSRIYAATERGLFRQRAPSEAPTVANAVLEPDAWQPVEGLTATISDLVIDPAQPKRWLAGTPAGVYRSEDGGASWEPISLPWSVWDMAFGPIRQDKDSQARLYLATADGLIWGDGLATERVDWQEADGLDDVLFFSVNPHPTDTQQVWAGSWGNNVGVSEDGGLTLAPLHNGLETLSALDILWHPTPGQITIGTIEGLYRTDDGGMSWFNLPGPLSGQTVHRLMQTDDGVIWAGAADGLWQSADYGVTWERAQGIPAITILRLGALATGDWEASGGQQDTLLWAGTEGSGLWISRDSGLTWEFAGLESRSPYSLLVDPAGSDRLIAATEQGLWAADRSDRNDPFDPLEWK